MRANKCKHAGASMRLDLTALPPAWWRGRVLSTTWLSQGIMLLIYQKAPNGGHVPLKVLSIETGDVLQSFKHQLHRSKKIDFIEQFNEKLLVKQVAKPAPPSFLPLSLRLSACVCVCMRFRGVYAHP